MRQLFTSNIPAQILATNRADTVLGAGIMPECLSRNVRCDDAERIVPKPVTDRKRLGIGDIEGGTSQRAI